MVFVYFKREGKTIASAELYLKSEDKPTLERFANLVELMTFNVLRIGAVGTKFN